MKKLLYAIINYKDSSSKTIAIKEYSIEDLYSYFIDIENNEHYIFNVNIHDIMIKEEKDK